MGYTAQDIVDRGLKLSRRPLNATNRADGLGWLNDVYLELCAGENPFRHLIAGGTITTTAGDQNLTAADFTTALGGGKVANRVISLTHESDAYPALRAMTQAERERFFGESPRRIDRDVPTRWTAYDESDSTNVSLWPIPDQAYTLGFLVRLKPTVLTLSDEPNWPDAWRNRVFAPAVAARMWEQFSGGEAVNMADRYWREHNEALARFTAEWGAARQEEISVAWGGALGWDSAGLY